MNKLGLSVITTFDSLDSLEGLNTSQLFSVLTAEWDNLKIALGKGLKGVFGDDVDNVLTNLITRIREFDPLADDGFFMKLKEGWQIAKVVFDNLNTKFEDVKSGFAEGGLSGALEGLIGEDMMTKLTEFFDLFDFTPITEAIQPLKDAWDGLKQSFIDSFPMIQEAGGKFGEFFSTTLAPAFINIFNSLISAVGGFIEFLTTGLENLSAFWDTWGADIITFVESTVEILSGAWTSAQEVFTTVTDAMMQVLNGDFGGAWETLKTGISDAFDTMKQTLEGAKDDWIEAGKNLLQGLADGINEKVTDVVEGAKEAGRKVLEGLKGILGIESPSKVARYYGQMTMEGYNLGLEDVEAGTLTQDLFRTDTFKSIVNTSVAENKGMTRGSSSSNSSNINFTYAPFISTADEDEAVRVLEPVVIRAVNKGSRRGKIR
jgi:phage-related protein